MNMFGCGCICLWVSECVCVCIYVYVCLCFAHFFKSNTIIGTEQKEKANRFYCPSNLLMSEIGASKENQIKNVPLFMLYKRIKRIDNGKIIQLFFLDLLSLWSPTVQIYSFMYGCA